MSKQRFDTIVIGGGTGGYVAAIRSAQRGLKTALIEAREMGGTCLNRGCIPSKTLIANAAVLRKIKEAQKYGITVGALSFDYGHMKTRKDQVVERIRKGLEGLIASNKITVFRGYGKFINEHEVKVTGGPDEVILEGVDIIIATGSEPRELAALPFDYKRVHDSTSLLNISSLPQKFVIIGGGIIGCEFACMLNALGVDVTILEMLPTILSTEGKHVADALTSAMKKQGIKIETNAAVQTIERNESSIKAILADGRSFEADSSLVAIGRKYNSDNLGLEKAGVIINKDGSIPVNERMQTNVAGIYAVGDVTAKWLLAHVASHQGLVAADNCAGIKSEMHYNAVPSVTFTHPEAATIGLTLEKALEKGYDASLGKFPFQVLGKSQATLETDGFAQVIVDKKTGQILGAQVVGYGASTLIAEMAVAMGNELTAQSVGDIIHAHPTTAEAWMEAALLAIDMPLHLPPKK